MQNLLTMVNGKKTYLLVAIGALFVVANGLLGTAGTPLIPGLGLNPANWINDLFSLFLVATGRSALDKIA